MLGGLQIDACRVPKFGVLSNSFYNLPMPFKAIRIITILALAVLYAGAQTTVDPARLKINGVGLNSTYAQVLSALGKPKSESKATHEECVGGREKTVMYPGLEVYFM